MAGGLRVDFEKGSFGIITKSLGRGASADVFKVERYREAPCFCGLFKKAVPDGLLALKEVPDSALAEAEISIYQKLNQKAHVNFLTLFFHQRINDGTYWLHLTYFDAPDLRKVLRKRSITSVEMMHIITQSVAALVFLQSSEIVHADLKPENMLWNRKISQLKFIDFGCASMPGMDYPELVCAGPYRGPSALFKEPYSHEIDSWALGCILYELPIGDKPLFEISIAEQIVELEKIMEEHPERKGEIIAEIEAIIQYDTPELRQELARRYRNFIGKEAPARYQQNLDYPQDTPVLRGHDLFDIFANAVLEKKAPFRALTPHEERTLKVYANVVDRLVCWHPEDLSQIKISVDAYFCSCYTL